MKVGIVGFAGVGKTTVFNALTGLGAQTGFGGKEKANLGMIKVPDARVTFLTEVWSPKKVTLAEIAFVDVAGPEGGQKEGGGLDSRVVNHMRECDALVQVVRGFESPALDAAADPLAELDAFNSEMVLTDLIQVENRLERLRKEADKNSLERPLMERMQAHLESGARLATLEFSENDLQRLSGYRFLTLKPCMALLNLPDTQAADPLPQPFAAAAAALGLSAMALSAAAEAEIAELPPADQADFLADLDLEAPARDRFVQAVYEQLDLISFLTMGPDECRAWTIDRGTSARAAAGKIHSDIERGFIRAEIIAFEDFRALGSEAKCREAGKLRLEGKEYIVQDGDIMHVRFNV